MNTQIIYLNGADPQKKCHNGCGLFATVIIEFPNGNSNYHCGNLRCIKCRAPGCTSCALTRTHYCRNCGDGDSDHRSSNCPFVVRHRDMISERPNYPIDPMAPAYAIVRQRLAKPAYAMAACQIGMNEGEAMVLQRGVGPGQAYVMTGSNGGIIAGVAPFASSHGVMWSQSGFRPAPTNITPQGGPLFYIPR